MSKNIELLGYKKWCEGSGYTLSDPDYSVLRVIEVNKNSCVVSDGVDRIQAELSGRFMYDSDNIEDYPATGDWVEAEVFDNNSFAIIHNILSRNTLLKRKRAGKTVGFQLIAANVDVGFIVQPANKININLFERYLVMLNKSGIEPLAVITKTDLVGLQELEEIKEKISRIRCRYIMINNLDMDEFGSVMDGLLVSGNTYCLLGSSGVGKSTLLNNLLEQEIQKTNEVRTGDGKGRHTTVSRQLLRHESGAVFIDTPGMRELGNFDTGSSIENTFTEFEEYARLCRFADCSHTHEAGCAVKKAIEDGKIEYERYDNYLKLKRETEHYDMQYHEKLQKDRKLSRVRKQYKNNHRR